ncbi:MAG: DUF3310 domain-containing protein [Pirellulales bacterium]
MLTKHNPISHPAHYDYSIQPIEVVESWQLGFHLGCVTKYIARAARKGSQLEDLKKARWYLDREIARLSDLADGRSI